MSYGSRVPSHSVSEVSVVRKLFSPPRIFQYGITEKAKKVKTPPNDAPYDQMKVPEKSKPKILPVRRNLAKSELFSPPVYFSPPPPSRVFRRSVVKIFVNM
jgi:hypothetical protein